MLSADHHTGLVVARIEGGDRDAPVRAHDISRSLVGTHDTVSVKVGGQAMTYYAGTQQSRSDLLTTAAIAAPLTAVAVIVNPGAAENTLHGERHSWKKPRWPAKCSGSQLAVGHQSSSLR